MSNVENVRIARVLSSIWQERPNEKNENRSQWRMEWEPESAGQSSEENGLIGYNECAKRDIEESLHRGLYM